MDLDTFSQQITALSQQMVVLRAAAPDPTHLAVQGALDRLEEALAELRAAEDEMRQQNRQLIESQDVLEAERQRWHALFDLAPDAYLVTDLNGMIVAANQAASVLLALDSLELVGAPLAVFVAAHHGREFRSHLAELTRRGKGRGAWEMDLVPHRGRQFPATVSVAELLAERPAEAVPPERVEWAWLIHDISEHRRIALELRAARDELELRVQERTAQLSAANLALQQNAELLQNQHDQIRHSQAQFRSLSHRLVELQERERSFVADRLYNEAAQVLAALGLELDALERAIGAGASREEQWAETRATLDRVMREMHTVATNLRPATLDRLGLVATLRQELAEFSELHGLQTQFVAVPERDTVRLPVEVETAVYRIVQDGLRNVAQHAHASYVGLMVTRVDGSLLVALEDDGVGFDEALAARVGALGLVAMRERAEALDGLLAVESKPGAGTTVLVRIPIKTTERPAGSLPPGGGGSARSPAALARPTPASPPAHGTSANTVVPVPGADSMTRLPPNIPTRSRMPNNPKRPLSSAASASKPNPSSSIMARTYSPARSTITLTCWARACRATFVRASCTTR